METMQMVWNLKCSHPGWTDYLVDSPEDARRIVRTMRRRGVDLIKIMPSGGVLSIGDNPHEQLMADDEIKAVVDTAHGLGMKVAAHAHGTEATNKAVVLGVDSIEHGSFADAETYRLMKIHGTYLVPTLLVGDTAMKIAQNNPEQLNPSSGGQGPAGGAGSDQKSRRCLQGRGEDRLWN